MAICGFGNKGIVKLTFVIDDKPGIFDVA